jgi:hypothetical protein
VIAYTGASEVDHGVHAIETTGVDRARLRIPSKGHLARPDRATHEPHDLVTTISQMGAEGAAD